MYCIFHYPSPTSKHIITMNPNTHPHVLIIPLPLAWDSGKMSSATILQREITLIT